MPCLDSPEVIWTLHFVQLAGIVSAWMVRISEGSIGQIHCQRFFLGCLAIVGLLTILSVALGAASWLLSGATLAIMVLAVIWDLRPHGRLHSSQSLSV
jgi:hypothetical protein